MPDDVNKQTHDGSAPEHGELLNRVIEQLLEQGGIKHDGCLELRSDYEYYLDLGLDAPGEWLEAPLLKRLGASRTYALNLVNRIGWLQIGPLRVRAVSPKLTGSSFRSLVADVSRYVSSLPFSHRGAAAAYDLARRAKQPPARYHTFVHVSHLLETGQLQAAVRRIATDPHVVFVPKRFDTRVERARRVDHTTVRLLCTSPRHFEPLAPGAGPAVSTLARRLRATPLADHFPGQVSSRRMISRLDNPENRFVRHALEWMLWQVASLQNDPYFPEDIRTEAEVVTDELERLLGFDLFRHVSRPRHIHMASQVLQRRAGYRKLLKFYSDLMLPPTPAWPEHVRAMLELKNAALLYEYWVFVTMCRLVEEITGWHPTTADSLDPANSTDAHEPQRRPENEAITDHVSRTPAEHVLPGGIRVQFPGGVYIMYNAVLPGYSGPFRPDITLETPAGTWVFDAKFRVQWMVDATTGAAVPDNASGNDDDTELTMDGAVTDRIAKSDDIHKMHTYRDALKNCRGAYVVYPGDSLRLYAAGKSRQDDGGVPLDGVGAVPAVPGSEPTSLRLILEALLLDHPGS